MNTKSFSLILLACLISTLGVAQKKAAPVFDSHHKNVFVELLGSNLLVGVNYDMRLKKGRMDGIGFRAGIGGISASGYDQNTAFSLGIVSLPLEFNYLVGKRRSSFVSGIGLLPIYASFSGSGELTNYEYVRGEGFGLAGGFVTLGYRHQPLRHGFMMQVNWNPMILRGSGFNAGWLGLSLGFGFK